MIFRVVMDKKISTYPSFSKSGKTTDRLFDLMSIQELQQYFAIGKAQNYSCRWAFACKLHTEDLLASEPAPHLLFCIREVDRSRRANALSSRRYRSMRDSILVSIQLYLIFNSVWAFFAKLQSKISARVFSSLDLRVSRTS